MSCLAVAIEPPLPPIEMLNVLASKLDIDFALSMCAIARSDQPESHLKSLRFDQILSQGDLLAQSVELCARILPGRSEIAKQQRVRLEALRLSVLLNRLSAENELAEGTPLCDVTVRQMALLYRKMFTIAEQTIGEVDYPESSLVTIT